MARPPVLDGGCQSSRAVCGSRPGTTLRMRGPVGNPHDAAFTALGRLSPTLFCA